MGLFNFFKKKEKVGASNDISINYTFDDNLSIEENFNKWLDMILSNNLKTNIVAINFNLYDDGNNDWSVEFIGASRFSEKDEDWACDEVVTTRKNPFVFKMESDWQSIEELITTYIKNYLEKSSNAEKLKKYKAIGVGFVDGDLRVIYNK